MGCIRWTTNWETAAGRAVCTMLALVATLLALGALAGSASAQDDAGEINVQLNASSEFDSTLTSATPEEQAFMNEHYSRMRGYAPFFDRALGWAPPAHFYQDLYALYRNDPRDEKLMQEHPDWVLRDAHGNALYIQFACGGGSCTQYAADVGSPAFRAHWIDMARANMVKGYDGIFIDDVNMEMKVSNGNGDFVRPVDPRTGAPMTDENWRRYVAEFTEQIRAAFPESEIVHNSLWWMDRNDPYVQRQVAAADYVEMERGFADTGIVGGSGQWSYSNYLSYVDWLHSLGKGAVLEPHELDDQSRMFELGSYFLVSDGEDSIAADYGTHPDEWWSGWDTDLGAPQTERREWKGLLRRDFEGGVVIVNEPDAGAVSVKLPPRRWTDPDGNRVKRRVALEERSALVLVKGPRVRRGNRR